MPVAFPIASFLIVAKVKVVRGMKRNPIPIPKISLGQITVAKPASRVNFDIIYVAYAQVMIPNAKSPFGFTLVTNLPAMRRENIVEIPPGPRTRPARNAV